MLIATISAVIASFLSLLYAYRQGKKIEALRANLSLLKREKIQRKKALATVSRWVEDQKALHETIEKINQTDDIGELGKLYEQITRTIDS